MLCEEWYISQWKCFDVALYKTTKCLLSLLPSFHSERLDTEPWMAFLEAELESEDLESYSQIGSLEKLPLLGFVVAKKAKFNSEKMGRNKIGSSCFPYSRISLRFPIQPFQLDMDKVIPSIFFFSEALSYCWLCACYNTVLQWNAVLQSTCKVTSSLCPESLYAVCHLVCRVVLFWTDENARWSCCQSSPFIWLNSPCGSRFY